MHSPARTARRQPTQRGASRLVASEADRHERLELVVDAGRERGRVLDRRALARTAGQEDDDAARTVEEADAADVLLARGERSARELVRFLDAGQLREQLVVALLRLA